MSVCKRPSHGHASIFSCEPQSVATAAAALALLAGLSTSASALSLFDGRPTLLTPRAAVPTTRPASPRTPATAVAARPTAPKLVTRRAGETEIARPRGPMQILISLDRQQLTLYA